ncbi:hypothetical protein ACU686_12670 [Yinghuangia aomiensis]
MSKEMARWELPSVVRADGDHSFRAVQKKLGGLQQVLDEATGQLDQLVRDLVAKAGQLADTADAVGRADLDPRFVAMTGDVAEGIGAAAREVRHLAATSQETADLTRAAKQIHARLYGASTRSAPADANEPPNRASSPADPNTLQPRRAAPQRAGAALRLSAPSPTRPMACAGQRRPRRTSRVPSTQRRH